MSKASSFALSGSAPCSVITYPVSIRTLDLGADKYTQSRARTPERNPFLGCRSLRFCLQNLPLFKTQLRAILRASVDSEVSIMFPLVTNLRELRQAKAVVRDVMEDLEEEELEHRSDIPIGCRFSGGWPVAARSLRLATPATTWAAAWETWQAS